MPFRKSAALAPICVLAAVASAAINIVPTFDPVGPGLTENPNVDGAAVVNFDEATFTTSVALVAIGLKKDVNYGVRIDSNDGGQANVQAFTARTFLGIGIYNTSFAGDGTFGTVIDIFKWDGDPDPFNFFEISPTEERARGFGSNVN
ncbi:MAG: hypothetical protein IT437_04570 [Phycisphaerales bacterium]|nr:hypothetical protein [Phycisphaerales bacterium]